MVLDTVLPVPAPETAREPFVTNQNIADANGADIQEYHNRWPQSRRDEHAAKGGHFAGPNKTFPIETAQDVTSAAKLYGHADDKSAVKSEIKRLAKEMGLGHALPDAWSEGGVGWSESCSVQESKIDKVGHSVRVTVIRGGRSVNGYYYDEMVLRSIARLIEGAQAYSDHGENLNVLTRSVRDLVGFYKNAEYVGSQGGQPGRVDADLHILEAADWLWSIITESIEVGKPDLVGLSIDILGNWVHDQVHDAKAVTLVKSLNSCDVVTRPSAGGSINRILHHIGGEKLLVETGTDVQIKEGTETVSVAAELAAEIARHKQIIESEVERGKEQQRLVEEQKAEVVRLQEQQNNLVSQRKEIEKVLMQARLDRMQAYLDKRLQESILPAAVRENVKCRFAGRNFEEQELETEINTSLNMLAELTRSGLVRGHGFDKAEISGSQITESEKIQAAFDAMMGVELEGKYAGIKGFTSIREAYARVTGTSSLQAGISSVSQLGQIAIHESAPVERITEADTTTASFSYLLGTSMNKRLLKDYQAWPAEWQKFCTIAPIRDYKQQSRVRLGAFGSLSIVPEDSAYTAVTLTDSAATYVPQKRGNLVTVSRETIINDDLQSIKQIPTKLAVAAAYTLAEFVYAFLSSNANIYDGTALFTSGGGSHLNLGASALSSAAMQTGVTAMREQVNMANKRLGLRPRYLIVPAELEFVAMVVTKSAGVPGSNNNDINPMLGYVTPIVSPQLSSTTQWFMAGDPREIDTIEIGFVGGQVNPALFIQDQPLFGLNFTQDAISYKCRHEYGGVVLDYRGLYRGL